MPDALATVLQQQLPHLTLLESGFGLTSEQLQQLPHSLQQLEFRLSPAQVGAEDAAADLAHLTALTSLSLPPATAQWVLPDSLLTLYATGECVRCAMLGRLAGLLSASVLRPSVAWSEPAADVLAAAGPCHATCNTHLQSLELEHPHLCPELVKQLPRLPQLRWLVAKVRSSLTEPEVAQLLPVAAAVGRATALTGLEFCTVGGGTRSAPWREVMDSAIKGIKGLTGLQKLNLRVPQAAETHLLQLTALTGLTNLDMNFSNEAVTDLVVVGLASKLQHLVKLELIDCAIKTQACLAPIGALRDLQLLDLESEDFTLTDAGLMQLSGLTKLTSLMLEEGMDVSRAAADAFLAVMPGLRRTGRHPLC
jgi:hypothetical protein